MAVFFLSVFFGPFEKPLWVSVVVSEFIAASHVDLRPRDEAFSSWFFLMFALTKRPG